MKAAVLEELDSSPVYKEVDDPAAANDEQEIIKVKAAPIKNLDKLMTLSSFYAAYSHLPKVIGSDGVGLTEEGKRVYAQGISGMYAEKAIIAKNKYAVLPDRLDFVTAAALPNAVQGSALPLQLHGDIKKDDVVLINGATGFTGQLAVQVAHYYQTERIIVTGRDQKRLEMLQDLGADEAISLKQPEDKIKKALKNVIDHDPIDIVLDYLWGSPATTLLNALKAGPTYPTRFINVGNMAGGSIEISAGTLRNSAIKILGAGLGSYTTEESVQLITDFIPEIFELAAQGKIKVSTELEPLKEIEKAWGKKMSSGTRRVITTS